MLLREWQSCFVEATLVSDITPVASTMEYGGALPREVRLAVYHGNVVGGLSEILNKTFPATCKLVGDDFFNSMARMFAKQHPPQSGNVNCYGGDFPAFIARYHPAASLPYLSSVARFEWMWMESYLAEDDLKLVAADLEFVDSDDYLSLSFSVHRSVRLIESDYPAEAIWRFCLEDAATPVVECGKFHSLLIRPEIDVDVLTLEVSEYAALRSLSMGDTLEAAVTSAMQADCSFEPGAFLARHFAANTFSSFSRPSCKL